MVDEPPRMMSEILVPETLATGIYANNFSGYTNATDFTIDFSVVLPAENREDADGPFINYPSQVVARIKLPPALIYRLMQHLESQLTQYEAVHGPVTPLGDEDIQPPEDE